MFRFFRFFRCAHSARSNLVFRRVANGLIQVHDQRRHPKSNLQVVKYANVFSKFEEKKHLIHLFVPQNPTFHSFLPDLAYKKLYSVRGVDFWGKVSGAISVFVCQFLKKRAVARFLFQIRTKLRRNIGFCCASALLCSFFLNFFRVEHRFFFFSMSIVFSLLLAESFAAYTRSATYSRGQSKGRANDAPKTNTLGTREVLKKQRIRPYTVSVKTRADIRLQMHSQVLTVAVYNLFSAQT